MTDNTKRDASHGAKLLAAWQKLHTKPGGRWLFSRFVGRMAPYTGTIGAYVAELTPGRAVVLLRDRPRVRNHLRSVHAIAIANLGELASGLAATAAMPPGVRGIPVAINIDYVKKARGLLTATGTASMPHVTQETEAQALAEVLDAEGDVVATVTVRWRLQPV